jgi:hypothetical protein
MYALIRIQQNRARIAREAIKPMRTCDESEQHFSYVRGSSGKYTLSLSNHMVMPALHAYCGYQRVENGRLGRVNGGGTTTLSARPITDPPHNSLPHPPTRLLHQIIGDDRLCVYRQCMPLRSLAAILIGAGVCWHCSAMLCQDVHNPIVP